MFGSVNRVSNVGGDNLGETYFGFSASGMLGPKSQGLDLSRTSPPTQPCAQVSWSLLAGAYSVLDQHMLVNA